MKIGVGRIDTAIENGDAEFGGVGAMDTGEIAVERPVVGGAGHAVDEAVHCAVGADGHDVGVGFEIGESLGGDVVVRHRNVFECRPDAAVAIGHSSVLLLSRLGRVLHQHLRRFARMRSLDSRHHGSKELEPAEHCETKDRRRPFQL